MGYLRTPVLTFNVDGQAKCHIIYLGTIGPGLFTSLRSQMERTRKLVTNNYYYNCKYKIIGSFSNGLPLFSVLLYLPFSSFPHRHSHLLSKTFI